VQSLWGKVGPVWPNHSAATRVQGRTGENVRVEQGFKNRPKQQRADINALAHPIIESQPEQVGAHTARFRDPQNHERPLPFEPYELDKRRDLLQGLIGPGKVPITLKLVAM
jgi:hypothetical protein